MKVILAPDSFKGTMSASEVCDIMQASLEKHGIKTLSCPVADGGEGTVDAFYKAIGGKLIKKRVQGPNDRKTNAVYLVKEKLAVIEMCAAAGLMLAPKKKLPEKASTYGVGQLIADAVKRGVTEIILGLGGSATTDGGCGMACALGAVFYDKSGKSFIPAGETLCNIEKISTLNIGKVKFTAMCDVKNTLFGKTGAAFVFSPQKGADEKTVLMLDEGLRHLADKIKNELNINVSELSGGGAAGGLGAGVKAFLGAELKSGIDTVLDAVKFEKLMKTADFIITGEGYMDGQTAEGKVISGIAKRTAVPVIAVCGGVERGNAEIYNLVSAVFAINTVTTNMKAIKKHCKEDLAFTMDGIAKLLAMRC